MAADLSRRALLGLAGAGAVAAGVGAVGAARAVSDATTPDAAEFYGAHQAGIASPAQAHLIFSAFDVVTDQVAQLTALLREWTAISAGLTQGRSVGGTGAFDGPPTAPPDDNGEAELLPPSNLTITVGFGASLFSGDGRDRFGIGNRLPGQLDPLPRFPLDALDENRSDGDIGVQVCADDPQVAMHAMRALKRAAFGTCVQRWSQAGFLPRPPGGSTPRNLFGFKDGTANVTSEADRAAHVWATGDPDWMDGGSYLVARRIAMTIEVWDRTSLLEQEAIVGRRKGDGAPLSGGVEFTEPDFDATRSDAPPALPAEPADSTVERLIPDAAHIRLAHPSRHGGRRMLRRGYNYQDGIDSLGRWDAGLFFLAYSRDPRTHVVPAMLELARHDVMNEYIRHTASAVFAFPPGVRGDGDWFGSGLFAG